MLLIFRICHLQEGADGTIFEMTPGTYYPRSTVIVHPLLSSIVNYCHASKFQGFDDAESEFTVFFESLTRPCTQRDGDSLFRERIALPDVVVCRKHWPELLAFAGDRVRQLQQETAEPNISQGHKGRFFQLFTSGKEEAMLKRHPRYRVEC